MAFPSTNFICTEVVYKITTTIQISPLLTSDIEIFVTFPTNEGSPLTQDIMDRIARGIANINATRMTGVINQIISRSYNGTFSDTITLT
jgi:hypothetical protein